MKFVCERCHTKYSIADDKVRQKILKIRCKTCENVITIRDAVVVSEAGPQRAAPPPAPGLNPPRSVEWHIAINGRQEGPLGLAALVTRILAVGRGDEVYVWNEHLDGWKEPKTIPEVAAEMRARASAGAPPLPPGVRRPPTPAAGRAHLPPPGGTGRSSASMPAVGVSARSSSGARGGGAAAAAAYAPISEQEELGEKTQISALDASMLSPEAAPAPARSGRHTAVPSSFPALADLSVSLPLPGSSASNGSSARPLPGSGLEGLDFVPVPVAASASGPKRPAAMAAGAGGVVSSPVMGGSTSMLLSQIGGRVARVRHPAIKYVITGAVLVGLIIVVAVLSMTGGDKKLGEDRPARAAPGPTGGADPEAVARAEAEKYFKSMVGEGPAPGGGNTTSKSVGPPAARRHTPPPARGKPTSAVDSTKPPPVAPPPVGAAPPPVEGVGVARKFAGEERRVAGPKKEAQTGAAKASFDHGKFMAVFKQQDHYQAIKSCYDRALKRDQKLRLGRLDITVGVAEAGSVRQVNVEAPAEFAAVSTCIRTTVRRWRFPATGESYEATFTMLLHGSAE